MTQNFKQQIQDYNPFNEMEKSEKESFLQFIDAHSDKIWTRENLVGHITSSAWIVNKDRTKVLMAHHNIYNSWAWLGGHNDCDHDCLHVCVKEVEEESGVSDIKIVKKDIFDIEVVNVNRHIKRGKDVCDHLHYNVTFLIELSEDSKLIIQEEENSGLKWIANDEVLEHVSEVRMREFYARLMKKVELMKGK